MTDVHVRPRRRLHGPRLAVATAILGVPAIAMAQGSNDPFSPMPIPVPGCDSGNTCTGADNFDAVCPYPGSTSPDKWYAFTGVSGCVVVDLCTADYDTKLYVLDAGFNIIGCNDDACGSDGFKSRIILIDLNASHTYLVAVDGWGGDCGTYTLCLTACDSCDVTCVNDEGESCGSDVNGGCNAGGSFGSIAVGSVCGTAWADGGTRDTDWFIFDHCGGDIVWTVDAEFPVVAFILNADCANIMIEGTPGDSGGVCGVATAFLPAAGPGRQYLFTATGGSGGAGVFDGYPCGGNNDYAATVTVSSTPPRPCIETVCALPCQPDCPSGPPSFRFYRIAGAAAGTPWSWKMTYPGQTTIGECAVPGATGGAWTAAQRFRDSINARAAANGCADIRAWAFRIPFLWSQAYLVVRSPHVAPGMQLFVGAANACPSCLVTLGGPPCPFNPDIEEVDPADLPDADCNGNGIPDWQDIVESGAADANGNGVPDACEPLCDADLNGDGAVDFGDLLIFLAGWGACVPEAPCPGDFDDSGDVAFTELLFLLERWGPCP